MAVVAPQSPGAVTREEVDPLLEGSRRPFRADIDGLRAIAVGLVVLFHADIPGFDGGFVGVDVFFVISGFLITQGLLAERARSGRIDIVGFWLKRARRLLPAAGLMIATVVVTQLFLRSPLVWDNAIDEALAAATYWSNVQVSGVGGGYFGARVESRPLLHTWSLSVEEQFYIVWPLLFVALSISRVRASRLAALAVASLIWSVGLTSVSDPDAYFSASSRAWEFLVGALVAVRWDDLRAFLERRPGLVAPMGLAGLGVIFGAGMWLGRGQGFPWPGAVLPVAGTVAFLLTQFDRTHLTGRWLAVAPVQWLGRVSYSWYLWHWPFLVLGREWLDRDDVATSLGLVLVALVVAYLSYRFVETPYRHRKASSRSGEVVGALVVPLAATLFVIAGAAGYRALVFSDPMVASIEEAADGWPAHLGGCYSLEAVDFEERCVFGQPDAATTVLVIGDSHAAHWMPTFDVIGRTNELRVVALQLGSCPVLSPSLLGTHPSCGDMRTELDAALGIIEPTLVISSSSEVYVDRESDDVATWRQNHRDFAADMGEAGIGFLVLHDIGRWDSDPLACLLADRQDGCGIDRATVEDNREPVARAEREALEQAGHGMVFDPLPILCDQNECRPVASNGDIVMQDSHHITRSYAVALAPELEAVVLDALGQAG